MSANLQNLIHQFIEFSDGDDDEFNALALEIFAHQFKKNLPYQAICRSIGVTPRTLKKWHQVPSVSINAFKELTLSCMPIEGCQRVFMTSGTTRGDYKGRNFHQNLEIYDLSMKSFFQRMFMSDFEKPPLMATLFFSEEENFNSSLSHYLNIAKNSFGHAESVCLYQNGKLNFDQAISFLRKAHLQTNSVALLGASFSFVHLLDHIDLHYPSESFAMPLGSKILDTGGFKGQSREIEPHVFYQKLNLKFGVPLKNCINMYGMTELSSQFYDQGQLIQPSVKKSPHWVKTISIDPITGQEMPKGEVGLLKHFDIANFNSVSSILTEDVGASLEDGFTLLGRSSKAQPKGCSISVDDSEQ